MPTAITVRFPLHLPTVQEFLNRYPHYSSINTTEAFLWNVIVTGENAVAATVATRLDLPAVSVVADAVAAECARRRKDLSGYVKQMSGAVMCSIMVANGHGTTGTKRAVGRPGWNRGEMYMLNNNPPRAGTGTSRAP